MLAGAPTWWVWALAAASHVAASFAQQRAINSVLTRLDVVPHEPAEQEETRRRWVELYLGIALVAFGLVRLTVESRTGAPVAAGALPVAVLALLAAGWASVWVFRQRDRRDVGPG